MIPLPALAVATDAIGTCPRKQIAGDGELAEALPDTKVAGVLIELMPFGDDTDAVELLHLLLADDVDHHADELAELAVQLAAIPEHDLADDFAVVRPPIDGG